MRYEGIRRMRGLAKVSVGVSRVVTVSSAGGPQRQRRHRGQPAALVPRGRAPARAPFSQPSSSAVRAEDPVSSPAPLSSDIPDAAIPQVRVPGLGADQAGEETRPEFSPRATPCFADAVHYLTLVPNRFSQTPPPTLRSARAPPPFVARNSRHLHRTSWRCSRRPSSASST